MNEERADPECGTKARRPRIVWRRILVIAVLTYLGVCMLVERLQSKLIYFPTANYSGTPADRGLAFEDLTLVTSDGVAIAAWYVPNLDAIGSIIFCHGNAGNISDRLGTIQALHRLSVNVLIFDYRGYGRSEGRPSEEGTYLDAEAAWHYLVETRGQSPDRIVLFGRSLGGAVAIELAKRLHEPASPGIGETAPAGLIVESTFTNLVDVGKLHYPYLPVSLIVTHRYNSIGKLPGITCPKLFIHGSDDTLIPIENGRKLFDAAEEPKQFLETPGGHNDGGFMYSPAYTRPLEAFLSEVLPRA